MKKIGFIGLGIMGRHMARNLLSAGYSLYVYDLNAQAVKELESSGAVACHSVADVAVATEIIITMLPNSPQVKAVVLGDDGIISKAKSGTLVIDMSSIAPEASREMEAALKKKGIRMLDAPVSGGEPKAMDGTLAIMVGGSQHDFDEAIVLFNHLGSSALLIGSIGSGNICKLANQMIVALNIAALSEGLLLAKKSGVDPEKVFNAIKGGLAGSTVMNAKAPMMLAANFKPGFKVDLHIKDLNNALEAAQVSGTPAVLTALAMQILQVVKEDGGGQLDHSAIAKYYEKLGNVTISN